MARVKGTVNKAKGRQSKKNEGKYLKQFTRTRKNKIKKITRSCGPKTLEIWLQKNPLVRITKEDLKTF